MSSRDGSHRNTFSLVLLLVMAIGTRVRRTGKRGEAEPQTAIPSLSPDSQGRVAASQSSRIKRLIEN